MPDPISNAFRFDDPELTKAAAEGAKEQYFAQHERIEEIWYTVNPADQTLIFNPDTLWMVVLDPCKILEKAWDGEEYNEPPQL